MYQATARRPASRTAATAGWALAALLHTAAAMAQPPAAPAPSSETVARAQNHAKQGRSLYDLRQYDRAIKEFEQAYQLDNDPAHLYNIAQAHRLADHRPEAIAAYRAYLDRVPGASNRGDVERRIAELSAAERPPNTLDPQPPPGPPAVYAPPPSGGWPGQAPAGAPLLADPTSPQPPAPGYPPGGYPGVAPYYYPPAPALAAAAVPPGHHTHDGLFLRVQLGVGYTSISFDMTDVNLSGRSSHVELALGMALDRRFVLFGEIGTSLISEPTVKSGNQSSTVGTDLSVFTFGVGAAFYVMPANIYFSGTLGGAQVRLDVPAMPIESKTGLGVTLSAGKEWWVSSNTGLGVALQLHGSAVEDSGPNPDTLTPAWISLVFSGTYN